ncbi:MAG TPA: class I SAM-dependent methyltransferase, partial [Catenuloplanes sp.]
MDVFGSVADLYEAVRPGYPPALAGAIVAHHGGVPTSVVEVGAGSGKGTEVLARIGAPLTCIEPDPAMAAVLAGKFPRARIHPGTFEQWSPPVGGVGVVACAMAWHWLDPASRNARARQALAPGGTLAVFGHRYDYADATHAAAVRAALDALDPTARERPVDWAYDDVVASDQFTDVRIQMFRRPLPLDKAHYLGLVRTFGPFLTRPPDLQRRGLAAL